MEIKEYKSLIDDNENITMQVCNTYQYDKTIDLNYTISIAEMMDECFYMSKLLDEHSYCVCFDEKQQIIGVFLIGIGDTKSVALDINGLSNKLNALGCYYFVLIHNHPLSIPQPSNFDINNYSFMKNLFEDMLVDSLIVGYNKEFCSINIFKDFDGLWCFDSKEEQEVEYIFKRMNGGN